MIFDRDREGGQCQSEILNARDDGRIARIDLDKS